MNMDSVAGVILGGGEGKRLQPLTRDRCKPAVPLAGKYRLVDVPVSNCINSGIRRIHLLTQFNSVSLHQHMQNTYNFDQFHSGYVRILAAQQTPGKESWFQGTADAVRQNLRYIVDRDPEYVLILSGDQLYRMDFRRVMREHVESGADVTICTKPVSRAEAGALGIMQADSHGRIFRFVEKPGDTPLLDELATAGESPDTPFLASMGIYVFNTKVLLEALDNEERDFGKNIIPASIESHNVHSYRFGGYWRDIGTIRAFWEANMELTGPLPEFNLYDAKAPLYTHMRYLPPSKINCCDLNHALLSEGCIVSGHRILGSVIGVRAIIGEGTVIEHTVVMGADLYERAPAPGSVPIGIGRDCFIRNAIVDKNARIGDGCYITPDGKPDGTVTDLYTVAGGVVVIPKNTVIPPGTRI